MSAIGKRYRRGLVVGKFCPLHRGHMVVIQSAIDACDQVVVISYTKPDFEACGRTAREAWIKTLFPQVRVLDAPDRSPSIQGIARKTADRDKSGRYGEQHFKLDVDGALLPVGGEADETHRRLVREIDLMEAGVSLPAA